jgi:hypothetical protein
VKTRQALTLEDKNELSLKQFIDKCDELGKAIDGDLSSANLESVKGSLVDLMLRCDTLPETISSLIGHPGLAFLSSTVLPKTLINSRSNTQRVILGSVFRLSREATVFKDIGWTDETTGKDLFDIIYKSYSEPSNLASFNGIVALLKKHGFLMSKGRPGQGGRTRFGIPRMVYNQILKAETTGTFYDIIPRPVKAPGVISKVVNDKPAQTVIGKFSLETLPPEWNEVKIPEILESRGFDRKILLQLANRKLCDPVDAKDYISWVAFDCENGKKDRRGQPISDWVSYFMASMRDDGCYSRPSNYISSEERKRIQRLKDREEEIARINALKQKEEEANRQLVALKFEEWFRILSDAHINKHYPQFARGRNTRTCREYSKELFEKTFTDVIINNPSIAVTDLSLAGENQDEARAAIEAQFGSSQKEEPENH